jgi:hypothetical protein
MITIMQIENNLNYFYYAGSWTANKLMQYINVNNSNQIRHIA